MLSSQHFYHRIIRKMVVAFGTIFNDIKLVRYNKAGTTEIERVTVPLSYAQKEKFYNRITQDPKLKREVQITLPRMSFELDSISYDPLRKLSNYNETFTPNNSTSVKAYRAVPYNFDFSLSIYVRNVEDGTQIVEQILPYFNPDLTITGDILGLGKKVDIPIILQSINSTVDAEGSTDNTRMIIWTLTFTLKGFMYGAVSNANIIRTATANTYDSGFNLSAAREFTVNGSTGSGTFKYGELVYEGKTIASANATAFVESWSPSSNTLIVVDTNGVFNAGRFIFGAVSNASYNVVSVTGATTQLTSLKVYPNPSNANVNEDFGFTTVYQEEPYIGNLEVADSTVLSADNENLSADDNNG
jgi:hypothetical protein